MIWRNIREFCAIQFAAFVFLLSTADALRCYTCNSRNENANKRTCVDLYKECQHNLNCRAEYVQECKNNENNCAVEYGPGAGETWRGCVLEPRITTISNDQICTAKGDITTCLCQVDMCNKGSRNPSALLLSIFPAMLLVANAFLRAFC